MNKIMVVDDSFTSRMYIKKCINMAMGDLIEITEAKDGQEALMKLQSTPVELIISDINMPVMCGFTLLRNLKEIEKFKDIPIIFITSLASDGRADNLIQLGATEVLKKPLTPALLTQALDKLNPASQEEHGWGS